MSDQCPIRDVAEHHLVRPSLSLVTIVSSSRAAHVVFGFVWVLRPAKNTFRRHRRCRRRLSVRRYAAVEFDRKFDRLRPRRLRFAQARPFRCRGGPFLAVEARPAGGSTAVVKQRQAVSGGCRLRSRRSPFRGPSRVGQPSGEPSPRSPVPGGLWSPLVVFYKRSTSYTQPFAITVLPLERFNPEFPPRPAKSPLRLSFNPAIQLGVLPCRLRPTRRRPSSVGIQPSSPVVPEVRDLFPRWPP